ncbi:Major facilitator family transporter [Pseudomonas syringae pv. antirrhini]|uniref:Major facilitator family transporter n=1 Tax=Pseudomonas syringae pv. antirrhini TaxID=251702 RepID=A0A0P9J852_9PSED|nr:MULTISPECIES: MFS transporter [Pseudomonas]KPW46114.1 Major facilitator family transporter [Pseudomonas syringae pv. antirrhini]RMP29220.1 Major facilitator family transporter [Pseudomonas syringae pv. antirrhini]RMP45290.1 Major facilitator family transporter [Pseudomonas syringae pv. antirrhini]RMW24063.1 Major facilitator family transporter [Pseudomonas syringae pv. antirrhini]WIN09357.1 MFS transporter [Pseudomonas syringae pv. antirrhini str. 126]
MPILPKNGTVFETDLPARLDRLPWGRFHTLLVIALGITWLLDGLEVTLAGSVAGALKASPALNLTNSDIGLAGAAYIAGAVLGALLFGWLADRLGRRKLFFITLLLYVGATAATAFSFSVWSFMLFRFLTGMGIGGEYTAINSTIQEFTPARYRGWVDLTINGTFWLGAALGAVGSIVLLDPLWVGAELGWRLCFGIGAVLGLLVLLMRLWLPKSPRWLLIHGQSAQATKIVEQIEADLELRGHVLPAVTSKPLRLHVRDHTPLGEVARTLLVTFRQRSLVGLTLLTAQAFFYNAIFFTYALVLTDFYDVPAERVGWYVLPLALGNFCGPLLLGRLFDVVGRRTMISLTYGLSGVLLAISGYLFQQGLLDVTQQAIAWMVIFFFASAAASSAYLTVAETFPLEIRALAIAVFYAFGTGLGGMIGPTLFGELIDTGERSNVFIGYLIGAGLMLLAALVQSIWGAAAERKSLEEVARPLSQAGDV